MSEEKKVHKERLVSIMKTWKPSKLAIFLSAIITIAAVAVVSTFGTAMGDNNGYAEYDMYPENGHAEHDSYTDYDEYDVNVMPTQYIHDPNVTPPPAIFFDNVSSGITDAQLTEMVENGTIPPNVTTLTLWLNEITDISPLAQLTNLTYLNLGSNQITDISPLASLTGLETLRLFENNISDISPLASLVNLRMLIIHDNPITDISPLAHLTNLSALSLGFEQMTDISPLAFLPGLTYLGIYDSDISDFTALAQLPNLMRLNLENANISDISSLPLEALTNLQELSFAYNPISDITHLATMVNLEVLDLRKAQISDVSPLSGLSGLTSLILSYNPITDATPLATLIGLNWLFIDGTALTQESIDVLDFALRNAVFRHDYASFQYPFSEDGIGASLSHLQVTDEIMIRAFYADDYPGILGLHDSFDDLTVALARNIAFVTNTTLRNFSWIEIYSDPNNPNRPGYPNQFWVRRIMQNVGDFHPERPFVVTWQPPLSADDRLFTGILFTDDNGMTRYFIFDYGRGAYDDWFGLYEFVPAKPYGSDSFLLPTPTPPPNHAWGGSRPPSEYVTQSQAFDELVSNLARADEDVASHVIWLVETLETRPNQAYVEGIVGAPVAGGNPNLQGGRWYRYTVMWQGYDVHGNLRFILNTAPMYDLRNLAYPQFPIILSVNYNTQGNVLEYIIWYSTSNGHLYEFRLNAAWMRDDAWYFIHRGPLH